MSDFIEIAKRIQCVICDVDGVLTNGYLYIANDGNEFKAFHVQDGMGLKLLQSAGIEVAVITTSQNTVIEHRMAQLGIQYFYKGQVDKQEAFHHLKQTLNLKDDVIAYIGDDLPDLPIIQKVGLGVAVANAVPQVKAAAVWQTEKSGGAGAVREVCDLILMAKGMFEHALTEYFKQ